MKRILLMVLKNLFFVPYGWFKLCWCAAHVDNYTEEERYEVLKYIDQTGNMGRKSRDRGTWCGKHTEREWFYVFSESSGLI